MTRDAQYRVPATTVLLGMVLDVQIESDDRRIFVDDWAGWLMVCAPNGFDVAPGKARLFLLRGELGEDAGSVSEGAAVAFERWNARAAEGKQHVDTGGPETIGYLQGRAVSIGYRSDKWGRPGTFHDYDHSFYERGGRPPRLYTDRERLESSSAAVLIGGSMCITERGIA